MLMTIRCLRRRSAGGTGLLQDRSRFATRAAHAIAHFYAVGTLGRFDNVEHRFAAAARKHKDQGEEFHALDYLVYAYLQLGRNDEAERNRDNLPALSKVSPSSLFRSTMQERRFARAAARTGALAEAENLTPEPEVQPQWRRFHIGQRRWGRAQRKPTGGESAYGAGAQACRRTERKRRHLLAEQVAIQSEEAGMAGVCRTSNLRCATTLANGGGP